MIDTQRCSKRESLLSCTCYVVLSQSIIVNQDCAVVGGALFQVQESSRDAVGHNPQVEWGGVVAQKKSQSTVRVVKTSSLWPIKASSG